MFKLKPETEVIEVEVFIFVKATILPATHRVELRRPAKLREKKEKVK